MKAKILQAISKTPDLANYFGIDKYNNDFEFRFGKCEVNGKTTKIGQAYAWFWLGSGDVAPAGIPDFVLNPESGTIFGYII